MGLHHIRSLKYTVQLFNPPEHNLLQVGTQCKGTHKKVLVTYSQNILCTLFYAD